MPPNLQSAQVLALGDAAGVLHLFELPRSLRRPLAHEGQLMEAFVAREAAHLADVAGRQVGWGGWRERPGWQSGGAPGRCSRLLADRQTDRHTHTTHCCRHITQGLRAAALAEAKRAEEGRRTAPSEDSSSVADQGVSQQQRQSVLSSAGGGTLAAPPAPVTAGGGKAAGMPDAAKVAGVLSGAEAAEAARAEAAYRQLEADVKEQLWLA